jgi:hypothetical protein
MLACNTQLTNGLDLLDAAGVSFIESIKPATTLATAKHCLGLEYDDYIEKRPICTVFSKYYSPDDINNLQSPFCINPTAKELPIASKGLPKILLLRNKFQPRSCPISLLFKV